MSDDTTSRRQFASHIASSLSILPTSKLNRRGPQRRKRTIPKGRIFLQSFYWGTLSPDQNNPCCALILLHLFPWQKLLASKNNQAIITMMGLDCKLFAKILEKFENIFLSHTPFNESGMIIPFEYIHRHKKKVQPAGCLGLVLVWTWTLSLDSPFLTSLFIWGLESVLLLRFVMTICWHKYLSPWQSKSMNTRLLLGHGVHCFMLVGQQWMNWSCTYSSQGILKYKRESTMAGPTTIT